MRLVSHDGIKPDAEAEAESTPVSYVRFPWARMAETVEGSDGLGCGFPCPGITMIGGRPSWGKSSLAEQASIMLGPHGVRIIYAGIELGWERHARNLGARARQLGISDSHVDMLALSSGTAEEIIYLSETALGLDYGPSLLVVDYLQLLAGPGETDKIRIDTALKKMHSWSKAMGVGIVFVAMMNRNIETGFSKRFVPKLSDLEHTGLAEQLADVAIFPVSQSLLRGKTREEIDPVSMFVAKNRDGKTGVVPFNWVGSKKSFEEIR